MRDHITMSTSTKPNFGSNLNKMSSNPMAVYITSVWRSFRIGTLYISMSDTLVLLGHYLGVIMLFYDHSSMKPNCTHSNCIRLWMNFWLYFIYGSWLCHIFFVHWLFAHMHILCFMLQLCIYNYIIMHLPSHTSLIVITTYAFTIFNIQCVHLATH